MKHLPLITVLTLFSLSLTSFSQENAENKIMLENFNEVKLNMTNLIGFKWLDIAYERTIHEEASFGISILNRIGAHRDEDDDGGLDEYRTFSITPYFRQFFSKKYAQGFFIEGFAMLHSGEDQIYGYDEINQISTSTNEKYTDFAMGISTGKKFVTKRGFIAELYLGIGRDLLGESDNDVVGRGGVSFGYRF